MTSTSPPKSFDEIETLLREACFAYCETIAAEGEEIDVFRPTEVCEPMELHVHLPIEDGIATVGSITLKDPEGNPLSWFSEDHAEADAIETVAWEIIEGCEEKAYGYAYGREAQGDEDLAPNF